MIISIQEKDLIGYVASQINNIFPDGTLPSHHLARFVTKALERAEFCFGHVKNKYYSKDGDTFFNHLNTDQYAVFLYYLSNSVYKMEGDPSVATKIYALNKSLHAVDMFYEVELPDIFSLAHPLGTVLGRGKYSDYLLVYQRCTVGANLEHVYPTIGEGVVMFGGSSIIGDSSVGDNVMVSVDTSVMDKNIPSDSVVFNRSPGNRIQPSYRNVIQDRFHSSDLNKQVDT